MVFIWYLHGIYIGATTEERRRSMVCGSLTKDVMIMRFLVVFVKGTKKAVTKNRNCLILNVAGPGYDPGTSGL